MIHSVVDPINHCMRSDVPHVAIAANVIIYCLILQYGGVVGAFNCQGAGWDTKEQRIKGYSQFYQPISGTVRINDIEWDQMKEASEMGQAEEYAVYLNQAEKLLLVTPESDEIYITIQPSSFEIFSFVPIMKIGMNMKFAPIGLTNMFNSGGTIQGLEYGGLGGFFFSFFFL